MHILILKDSNDHSSTLKRYTQKLDAWGITYEVAFLDEIPMWGGGKVEGAWLSGFCKNLYAKRAEYIDVVQFFLSDWRGKANNLGHHFGAYSGYQVCAVKNRSRMEDTALHEDMHTLDNFVYIYLGISLSAVADVENWDEDVVHGRDPRFVEYRYDAPWSMVRSYVEKAIEQRKKIAVAGLRLRLAVLLREKLLTVVKPVEAITQKETMHPPLPAEYMTPTQRFGVPNARYPQTGHHIGVDYAAPEGTPIYAPADGWIVATFDNHPELGNACYFEFTLDGETRTARYLHMQHRPDAGQYRRGDFIGRVGKTGEADGPHVHVDVCRGEFSLVGITAANFREKFIDPEPLFNSA